MPINQTQFDRESTLTIVNIAQRTRTLEAQMRGVRSLVRLAYTELTTSTYPSVTFSNVPTDYQYLSISASLQSTKSALLDELYIRFNGSTTSYYYMCAQIKASTVTYYEASATSAIFVCHVPAATGVTTVEGGIHIRIFPTRSTIGKTVHSEGSMMQATGSGGMFAYTGSGTWNDGTAISSITLVLGSGNMVAGGTISLYGEP